MPNKYAYLVFHRKRGRDVLMRGFHIKEWAEQYAIRATYSLIDRKAEIVLTRVKLTNSVVSNGEEDSGIVELEVMDFDENDEFRRTKV